MGKAIACLMWSKSDRIIRNNHKDETIVFDKFLDDDQL